MNECYRFGHGFKILEEMDGMVELPEEVLAVIDRVDRIVDPKKHHTLLLLDQPGEPMYFNCISIGYEAQQKSPDECAVIERVLCTSSKQIKIRDGKLQLPETYRDVGKVGLYLEGNYFRISREF